MKKIILFIFIVTALFLAACTLEQTNSANENNQDIQGQTDQNQQVTIIQDEHGVIELQPNQRLKCGANQVVQGTQCVCQEGYKICNRECVPLDYCCSDSDCSQGICTNGVCNNPCDEKLCPYNQVCSSNTGECSCKQGTKWCARQQRCIGIKQCCESANCNQVRDGESCTDIFMTLNVCTNGGSRCKFIREDLTSSLDQNEFYFSEVYEGDMIDIQINGESFENVLVPNTLTLANGSEAIIKDLNVRGGLCKTI